ncbi:MAG: hypothetical protein HC848_01960 [Limnobacter sp.]|nr:hypothetical protein [Limnobacter sp.]
MHHKAVQVLGMDAATTLGRYGLRGEIAYTRTDSTRTASTPWSSKPFLYLVAGGDRTFDDNLNVNLQYFAYRVSDYTDPRNIADPLARSIAVENAVGINQLEKDKQGISAHLSKTWMNDTLEGEISSVIAFGSSDYVVLKPRLVYAVTDRFKVTLGADIFRGEAQSTFGRLRDASTGFIELKHSF